MANQATRTAIGPMAIVTADQYSGDEERLIRDDLACRFLPAGRGAWCG